MTQTADSFLRLLEIMDDLREKCPWDKKQTLDSLRPLTLEEVYELGDAILDKDMNALKEEIGDVMLHLVFYSKIAEEQGAFTIKDVLTTICDKLIHRHPHIYGDVVAVTEEEVKKNWEQLKLKEGKKSILSGVPNGLPAVIKAYRMQEKTKQVGFEWENTAQVWAKVQEEIGELEEAVAAQQSEKIEEEFGDVLFSLINYARFLKIDPEAALEKINRKFKNRFQYIEQQATKPLSEMSLDEMQMFWDKAKSEL